MTVPMLSLPTTTTTTTAVAVVCIDVAEKGCLRGGMGGESLGVCVFDQRAYLLRLLTITTTNRGIRI